MTPEQRLVSLAARAPLQRGFGYLPILGRDGRDVAWSDGVETHPGRGWKLGWRGLDDLISETTQYGKYKPTHFCKARGAASIYFWQDMWCVQGNPEPNVYSGSALTFRQFDDTVAGGFPHGGNVAPDTKHCLWIGFGGVTTPTLALLYDRVGAYEACPSSNTLQTMTNTLTPQRYNGQLGIMAGGQASATTGSMTFAALTYTNQAGGMSTVPAPSGRTFSSGQPVPGPTQCAGLMSGSTGSPFFPLASGDSGVQNIVSYQMSATDATGTLCFVLGYPIAYFGYGPGGVKDLLRACVAMERILDGAHLTLALFSDSLSFSGQNEFSGMFGANWG